MIRIGRTNRDGTVSPEIDQDTYETLLDIYDDKYEKEMSVHGLRDVAHGSAVMSTMDYAINAFLFSNGHIRVIDEKEYPS